MPYRVRHTRKDEELVFKELEAAQRFLDVVEEPWNWTLVLRNAEKRYCQFCAKPAKGRVQRKRDGRIVMVCHRCHGTCGHFYDVWVCL